MELTVLDIEKPEDLNFILGHAHFIKTVEDLYEAIVQTNPAMRFGVAFCEASQKALVRWVGNDQEMIDLAVKNASAIAAGHTFIIMLREGYPVNILNTIKMVPEVTRIYCATANPSQLIMAETEQGRAVLGVVDGMKTRGVEDESDIADRKGLLRAIGYKL